MRIASSSFGTTGWNGQIMDAAFRNPDGSTALVVHNENDNPAPFAVAEGDASFDYTLPGGALATFTWPASGGLDDGLRLVPADPMTATATVGGADAPKAVDDDASTRWATGTAQQPGQTLQVDLGGVVPVRRVVLDTGPDVSDLSARVRPLHQHGRDRLDAAARWQRHRPAHPSHGARECGAVRADRADGDGAAVVECRRSARVRLSWHAGAGAQRAAGSKPAHIAA